MTLRLNHYSTGFYKFLQATDSDNLRYLVLVFVRDRYAIGYGLTETSPLIGYAMHGWRISSASGTRIPLRLSKRRRIQVDDCDVRVRADTERRSPERQAA